MRDKTLLIVAIILEALAIYNLWDMASAMYLHLSKSAPSANAAIASLKKAMRRDRARLFVPTNGKVDSRDVNCDYLTDLTYVREDGEEVFIKDYIIPSVAKLTAGSATSIYKQGQTVPIRYSKRFKKLVVVDLPEVRRRQVSWVWLILWTLSVLALTALLLSVLGAF